MPLTYPEARLFIRGGHEMRREGWPPGNYVREVKSPPAPAAPAGYELALYSPPPVDVAATDWRMA